MTSSTSQRSVPSIPADAAAFAAACALLLTDEAAWQRQQENAADYLAKAASAEVFERSLQAQILIPLATSLAFGLATATIAALFLVPAVYTILDDLGWLGALDQEADETETSGVSGISGVN